jgi:polyhydroxyalkanoate synthesis regulator phasin
MSFRDRCRKELAMIIDDLRKTLEGVVGTLTPARAQQLAKDMLEPSAAKEQVAKTAADLLEWSQTNRERLSSFVRREISDQLRSVGGVATQAELDALKKRVRDLERAAGKTASGGAKTTRSSGSRTRATAKKTTASSRARRKAPAAKRSTSASGG